MGLSRLDNFLKSARGTILYVDPNALDSTDSIENQGNSLTRPFKTIQRALVEAARFSYQRGRDNDRFGKTTILLYPGEHIVDNRPGWIPTGSGQYQLRSSQTSTDFSDWDLTTNFDVTSESNVLYKLNSVYGGVIIPRGTSIVGLDLRKTKIRPTYVPNPENNEIERSCVFRLTGACYIWQFTVLDADPNGQCYYDYTVNKVVPNFSHHKLTAFEYADGVNNVIIDDDFISKTDYGRTDLDMYYEKVGLVYGQTSGREIPNDYPPSSVVDIEPVIDEYRIVGSRGSEVGITSIRAGDGITATNTITVTTSEGLEGISVDTPIQISGVSEVGYDGKFVVYSVTSDTEFTYKSSVIPGSPLGSIASATASLSVDTVTSASPYIFNISLRSVYGMCGLLADGDKATGFKSMVVAQFTGVGLQKDDNAFVKYDTSTGTYKDSTSNFTNLFADSNAKYKPAYENFHIKATNDAYLQLVSVFAIGYAQHFVTENGGDMSINNSNSNFGSKALVASGFKREAFARDNTGYITHIITPQEIEAEDGSVEFIAVDVDKTVGIASTNRLYLYNYTDENNPPTNVIDGFRIGAKVNDQLYVQIVSSGISSEYSARIIMPSTEFSLKETSYEKSFTILKTPSSENSIVDKIVSFGEPHSFKTGESIRIISDDGNLPSSISPSKVYYAITNDLAGVGIGSTQIKIAQTYTDAFQNIAISPSKKGGNLTVVSRVSDKNSGDVGHPVQWDASEGNWYINVATASTENQIYPTVVGLGTTSLGYATPRTYIKRKSDFRNLSDTIYKVRYVIPKSSSVTARPPLDAFVLQDAGSGIGTGTGEISKYFDLTNTLSLSNENELRNPRFISSCTWSSSGIATVTTELPHDLKVGNSVEIVNVQSTPNNTTGIANTGFNGTFTVSGVNNTRQFTYQLSDNPGTFSNNTSVRDGDLPRFSRKTLTGTYQLYRSQEVQEYIPNVQDGVYHLLVVDTSNSPSIEPFTNLKFSQPIQYLYPQFNRDNPTSDPEATKSFAVSDIIGKVVINEPQKSLTKEALGGLLSDINVGFGITNIVSNSAGTAHTIHTTYDHGFAGITSVSITGAGSTYTTGTYYNVPLVGAAGSTTGDYATAAVTVSVAGTISNVVIMNRGSAYGIGNTLSILDIPRNAGSIAAYVTVQKIQNNVGDTLVVSGVSSSQYNGVYSIAQVPVGSTKAIVVGSANSISSPSTTGIGVTATSSANVVVSGASIGISSITYDATTGISTVSFSRAHGFRVNDKIRIGGASDSIFNNEFIVKTTPSVAVASTQLTINTGIKNASPIYGGTLTAYPLFLNSYGGDLTLENEKTSSRLVAQYAGITTVSTTLIDISSTNNDPLTIQNAVASGLRMGDYIQIDNEIFRIRSAVISNQVYVFRSVLGTQKQTHLDNSVVRKVKPLPIEFRRNSIIRASGHTFEYMGFGPGNYSTALPERQNRIITGQEEILSQATKVDGGVAIFTGMNSDGDFYTGNKKINSSTGQEEIFDAPVPTVTGEEPNVSVVNIGFDVLTPLEISVNRSIRVEGGPDSTLISEFDGPVVFNNKITSTSSKGIEATSLYLQGNAFVSRNFTVGISTPTEAGNPGDVVTRTEPQSGKSIGWVYTTNNRWEKFGIIGDNGKEPANRIGISSNGTYIGISTLIDIRTVGDIELSAVNDDNAGITSVTISNVSKIGVSQNVTNNFVGMATQINFIGYGLTVTSDFDASSGIATVTVDGLSLSGIITQLSPSGNIGEMQYNFDGVQFGAVSGSSYDLANNQLNLTSSLNVAISTSSSALVVTQTGTGNALLVQDEANDASPFVISNNGGVGIGRAVPQARIDITSTDETSLRIRSTYGGGPVVRIDSSLDDTSPFIIDASGSVGINTLTVASGISLDVVGNAGVTGEIRYYNSTRTNYVAFKAQENIASNVVWSLPNVVGAANSILYSVTPGILGWTSIQNALALATTDDLPEGSANLYYTDARVVNKVKTLIGDQCGITVVFNEATQKFDYEVIVTPEYSPWPYSTRGFALSI
jgi:hypothetical protein